MNSRTKGHDFERLMAEKLREAWPERYTMRFKGTLWLDHCGADLVNTTPFNIQLKAMERTPVYHDILNYMSKRMLLISQFLNCCNKVVEI